MAQHTNKFTEVCVRYLNFLGAKCAPSLLFDRLLQDTKGGKQPFAASARSKEQREESGPSGHLPVFSVVQTRRMAAENPNYRMLQGAMNDRKPHGSGHSLCSPRPYFHDHFNKKLNL